MTPAARPGPAATPSPADAPERLAAERFVSLTTFRRTGQAVPTPVWVVPAPDHGELVVMTPVDSGKVTRLRRDPRVELRPCNRFGRVAADAAGAPGTAVISSYDADLERLFRAKYGLEYRLVMAAERRGRRGNDRVALRIRLTHTPTAADDPGTTPPTTSTKAPEENTA